MRFLIIPCYNEFSRLQASEVVSCVDNLDCIVVLVNDGSTDKTKDLLQQISLVRPAVIKVLNLERNIGKGEAVRAGFNFAISQGASEVGFCDADFAVGHHDLLELRSQDQQLNVRSFDITLVECSRLWFLQFSNKKFMTRNAEQKSFALIPSLLTFFQNHFTAVGHLMSRFLVVSTG